MENGNSCFFIWFWDIFIDMVEKVELSRISKLIQFIISVSFKVVG